MRAPACLAASLLVLLAGCRSRLPVDRPRTDLPAPPPAPAAALQQVRVEYYQISDGWENCKRVIRAVRALLEEPQYQGRLAFEVYPWDHDKSSEARETYEFGPDRHGMVVLAADGRLLTMRAGHSYGAVEIRHDFDLALEPPAR